MSTLSFNDTIFSQEVLNAFTATLAPVSAFSKDFSGDARGKGDAITIPFISSLTATTYNASTANYQTAGGTVTHNTVNLDQHNVISVDVTDLQAANSSAARLDQMAYQAGRALGVKVLENIFKVITTANFGAASVTTAEANYTLAQLIALRKVLAQNNIPMDQLSYVFNPIIGASLLGSTNVLQAYAIGDNSPVRNGTLGKLVGFDTYETNILPTASTSLVAFACHPDAIAVAMRYLAPQAAGEYLAAEQITNEAGLTIGMRRSFSQATGTHHIAFECLYGVATGLTLGLALCTKP